MVFYCFNQRTSVIFIILNHVNLQLQNWKRLKNLLNIIFMQKYDFTSCVCHNCVWGSTTKKGLKTYTKIKQLAFNK